MSRLLLPFASAVLLVIGCSQNAVAENNAAGESAAKAGLAQSDASAAKPANKRVAPQATAPAPAGDSIPVTCIFGEGDPTPCTMTSTANDSEGGITIAFRVGPDTITFRGKRQDRWWSGTLNDAPAMAYELNRGHVVFNSRTLDHYFEYWTKGNEHGSY